ncbi:MAG: acyl-CoA dehydrogenase family protein [Pseudomonadota bacterium]|nr:acyl-CoA dehydrogenase family protein [Pseudomonadota bacterium]
MTMVLSEEQILLKDTAREFIQSQCPVGEFRKLRDAPSGTGYSAAHWRTMVELGWPGILLPEDCGGMDFGYVGLGGIMEEAGRTLLASPLFATVILGAQCVQIGGSRRQRESVLPKVVEGKCTLALALDEGGRHAPLETALSARTDGDGFVLNGRKTFVLDGGSADQLIVVARSAGSPGEEHGLTLFLVDANSAGISRRELTLMDERSAAQIDFSNVRVERSAVLGEVDQGWKVLSPVLDAACILLAAEMLGGISECFDRTVAYLKDREQFGVKIGSFQALKHRAAKLFAEVELCRAAVRAGLVALDRGSDQVPLLASLAKSRLNDIAKLATNEAVQMHGGIGVTDELDIGLFLKRARVTAQTLGDSSYHSDRFARLSGY